MTIAVLFPGQGSQFVGMGAGLFESRPGLLVDTAEEILGWSLRDVCLDGPEERLTRTEFAQPALFAVAYALWTELAARGDLEIRAAAGHSLGEFTALAAAGAITFEDALRVVSLRGSAMARAADAEPSGMAALIGADAGKAAEVARLNGADGGRLQVANINAPGQVVVAGAAADIDWVAEHAGDLGLRRVMPLKVAGAFHSSFMAPAAGEVEGALGSIRFSDPRFPVWSNTTARPHETSDLAATLAAQMVSTVRFSESLEDMRASGVTTFVHVGPGDVTAGMARRTLPDASVHVVSETEDIPSVIDAIVSIG